MLWATTGAIFGLVAALKIQSAPVLRIVDSPGLGAPAAGNTEQTGDPGGSLYPGPAGIGPGAGIPWQTRDAGGGITGGWPSGPGLTPDVSFTPDWGVSGWHSSYLYLTEPATVRFQFMGAGDSSLVNEFWVNGTQLFRDDLTPPSPVAPLGATFPVPDHPSGSALLQNEYTFDLPAGLVPFQFKTGAGIILDNLGIGIGNPDPHAAGPGNPGLPGYFLGVDPYLTSGNYETQGQAVYAGLSDLPASGDHDYQDMGVRIVIVPESGTWVAGLGIVGFGLHWGLSRRRTGESISRQPCSFNGEK